MFLFPKKEGSYATPGVSGISNKLTLKSLFLLTQNVPENSMDSPRMSGFFSSKNYSAQLHFELCIALSRPDQPSLQDLHWQARAPTDRTLLHGRTVLYVDLQFMQANVFLRESSFSLVFVTFWDFERNPGILHVLSRDRDFGGSSVWICIRFII